MKTKTEIKLLRLAQKYSILRISRQGGLTAQEAIELIEENIDAIQKSDFPKSLYWMLK